MIIIAEINEIENSKTIANTTEIQSKFFDKINKSDKVQAKQPRKKERRHNYQYQKQSWVSTIDCMVIKRVILQYKNDSMLTNLLTLVKLTNTLKDTNYQNSHKET